MTERSDKTSMAFAVMIATPLVFSSNLIFGKSVVDGVAPFNLAFLRWLACAIILSPLIVRNWSTIRPALRSQAPRILLLGFLGMWVCGAIVYMGLVRTSATNATLLYTTSPIFILLIERLFHARPMHGREWIGVALAFCGVTVILMGGDLQRLLALSFNLGDGMILIAAISWATYTVVFRGGELKGIPALPLFGLIAASGAALLAPFALFEFLSGAAMPDRVSEWQGLAGIIGLASLMAFAGFQFGIRHLGPSLAGVFMYLLPPYGVLLAVVFLGEAFRLHHLAGIVLVTLGVVLATIPRRFLNRASGTGRSLKT